MRKRLTTLALGVALGWAGAAQAAPVAYDYTATLTVNFAALAPIASGPVAGTTNVDDVTGAFTLPASIFPFATTQTFPTPATVATAFGLPVHLNAIAVTGNNAMGNLNTAGSGTLSIQGLASLFLSVGGIFNLTNPVPLTGAFGVNNTLSGISVGFGATVLIAGQSFVNGVVSAQTTTPTLSNLVTVTAAGSGPSTTAGGAVNMSLVTATQVVTDSDGGGQDGPLAFTAVFGRLDITLTPVPEPATVAMLGSGLVGLVLLGSRRRR
jgi:hypothetical protein